MATERGLYIISIIHNGDCFKTITLQLDTVQPSPWPIYSLVENSYS